SRKVKPLAVSTAKLIRPRSIGAFYFSVFLMVVARPRGMALKLLSSERGDRDLTSARTVLAADRNRCPHAPETFFPGRVIVRGNRQSCSKLLNYSTCSTTLYVFSIGMQLSGGVSSAGSTFSNLMSPYNAAILSGLASGSALASGVISETILIGTPLKSSASQTCDFMTSADSRVTTTSSTLVL